MKALIESLRNNNILKYFSYSMSASFIVQIRSFIFIWIATKYLSVEQYGIFTLALMLIMTAADLSDMGVNATVTRFCSQYYAAGEYEKEHIVFKMAFKRKIINALIVVIIMNIFAGTISELLFGAKDYRGLIQIASVGVLGAMLNGLNVALLQGRKLFRSYLKIVLNISVAALLTIAVICLYGTISIEFLIIYHIVIIIFSFLYSIYYVDASLFNLFAKGVSDTKITKNFNKFGFWMFLWAVLSVIQSKVDMLMLANFANVAQVAYYDIAMKITKPILMVFAAYGQVLNPIMAGITDKGDLILQVKKTTKFVMVISAGLLILLLFAKVGILFIFGTRYLESIIPLQIILFALLFFVWTMPYNSALFAMNQPQVFTFAALVGMIVTIVGNYLLLPKYGAVGAATTFLIVQSIGLAISFFAYRKFLFQYK